MDSATTPEQAKQKKSIIIIAILIFSIIVFFAILVTVREDYNYYISRLRKGSTIKQNGFYNGIFKLFNNDDAQKLVL